MQEEWKEKLIQELEKGVREILLDLYKTKEKFYYITLCTHGLANSVTVSAWSVEALAKVEPELKWSYADSPYCSWKQEFLEKACGLLQNKNMSEIEDEEFFQEYEMRLEAMEQAMLRLDQQGLFEMNQPRNEVMVLAEVMPPDESNLERAYRMNDKDTKIFYEWLKEEWEL